MSEIRMLCFSVPVLKMGWSMYFSAWGINESIWGTFYPRYLLGLSPGPFRKVRIGTKNEKEVGTKTRRLVGPHKA